MRLSGSLTVATPHYHLRLSFRLEGLKGTYLRGEIGPALCGVNEASASATFPPRKPLLGGTRSSRAIYAVQVTKAPPHARGRRHASSHGSPALPKISSAVVTVKIQSSSARAVSAVENHELSDHFFKIEFPSALDSRRIHSQRHRKGVFRTV